ncbi:type II toxin-antitoxin system death-on-curing family toxin [Paracidovorax citrulli]
MTGGSVTKGSVADASADGLRISIPPDQVREIHHLLLQTEPGLPGEHPDRLEGALARVDNAQLYEGVEDLFEIAAHYAAAIAVGHCFVDGNKRTGLVTALTYPEMNGVFTKRYAALEDAMVDIAQKELDAFHFADLLFSIDLECNPEKRQMLEAANMTDTK